MDIELEKNINAAVEYLKEISNEKLIQNNIFFKS